MSLDNLKQAVKDTSDDPPLQTASIVDGMLIDDAPAPPIFGLDTSLKDINDAIRRAEFRALPTAPDAHKSNAATRHVLQEFRLNETDDGAAALANEAAVKRLTAENARLRTQVVRFLES